MNEEEQKAVEFVKNLITWDEDLCPNKKECEQFEIILNLIEKLQKENELAKQALIKNCNIADERNQLLKENEELKDFRKRFVDTNNKESQEANEYFMFRYTFRGDELAKHIYTLLKVANNSIPIQKVKDKIEKEIKYHEKNILDIENVNMLKSKTAKEEAEIEFNKYAIVVLKKILQELIEERSDANENM